MYTVVRWAWALIVLVPKCLSLEQEFNQMSVSRFVGL